MTAGVCCVGVGVSGMLGGSDTLGSAVVSIGAQILVSALDAFGAPV